MLTLESNHYTEIVKVIVGREQQPFIVHKHVLTRIPFFEACLRSNCIEAQTGVITLMLGPPAVFATVLDFVTATIPGRDVTIKEAASSEDPTVQENSTRWACNLYRMAHFLMLERLMNAVIDDQFAQRADNRTRGATLSELHKCGLQDSKMMDMLLINRARILRAKPASDPKNGSLMVDYFEKDMERANKLMAAVLDPRSDPKATIKVCEWWHTHDYTPKCGTQATKK
jgi:hypothetical protein